MNRRGKWALVELSLLALATVHCADVLDFKPAELVPDANAAGAGSMDALGAADSDSAWQQSTLCERYCQTVIEACPSNEDGSYAVYDSLFSCQRQCQFFEEGQPGDQTGNTLNCRLSQAQIALAFPGERLTACPAAGPGGNGVCGENCEGYCTLMQAECQEYDSDASCLSACNAVPDLGGFDVSIVEGDSLQCRFYHLNAALVSPLNHCPHAAGDFPCAAAEE